MKRLSQNTEQLILKVLYFFGLSSAYGVVLWTLSACSSQTSLSLLLSLPYYTLLSLLFLTFAYAIDRMFHLLLDIPCHDLNGFFGFLVAAPLLFIAEQHVGIDASTATFHVWLLFVFRMAFLVHKNALAEGRMNKHLKASLVVGFIVWVVIVLAYVNMHHGGSFKELVWEKSDFRHYHWLSSSLIKMGWDKSHFQIGLPSILVPMNAFLGVHCQTTLESTQILNQSAVFLMAFTLMPLGMGLTLKAAFTLIGNERLSLFVAYSLACLLPALYFFYTQTPPHYASSRDALYHPLMMLGLVSSVETLNFLCSSFLCYAIVRQDDVPNSLIGIVCGFSVLVKISNALIVLFFAVFCLIKDKNIRSMASITVCSLVVYAPQIFYNKYVYGVYLFANRISQWSPKRAAKWAENVRVSYGLDVKHASLMSPLYLSTNIKLFMSHYWALTLLATSFYLHCFIKDRRHRLQYAYFIVTAFSFIIFHLCFIRIGATFRYNQAVLPQLFIIAACSLGFLANEFRHIQKDKGHQ